MHDREPRIASPQTHSTHPVSKPVPGPLAARMLAFPNDPEQTSLMRTPSRRVVGCLSLLALLGLASGCDKLSEKFGKAKPVEFRTNSVVRTNIVQSVSANGAISPTRLIQVGSQVSGTIVDLKVDFNSVVKEGEVIAKIDPASFERALARADADLASSKAQEALSDFNLKRAKELFAAKLISETEYTQTDVSLQQAVANSKMRDAAVESARVDLQRTTIYAPVNGVVIQRNIEVGQTVASSFSTPTLFTIADDLSHMQIELAVSEADIGSVDVGQRVDFGVDAFQSRKFSGRVKQVRFAPTTNQNVVTYTTVVSVENPEMRLRPGMTATASIVTSDRTNVLVLSAGSLRFTPPATGVKVLAAAGAAAKGTAGAGAPNGPDGFPVPPWQGEGRRPTDEERQKFNDSLNAEQKAAYQKFRDEMRKRMAEGGGPGGGGGGGGAPRPARPDGPTTRTVYVLDKDPDDATKPAIRPVTVKLGITDGIVYEVLSGLNEGDVVITGVKGPAVPDPAAQMRSPLNGGGGFGGGRPPGR